MLAHSSPNLNIFSLTSPEETKESCLTFLFNVHVSYYLDIKASLCMDVWYFKVSYVRIKAA